MTPITLLLIGRRHRNTFALHAMSSFSPATRPASAFIPVPPLAQRPQFLFGGQHQYVNLHVTVKIEVTGFEITLNVR